MVRNVYILQTYVGSKSICRGQGYEQTERRILGYRQHYSRRTSRKGISLLHRRHGKNHVEWYGYQKPRQLVIYRKSGACLENDNGQ